MHALCPILNMEFSTFLSKIHKTERTYRKSLSTFYDREYCIVCSLHVSCPDIHPIGSPIHDLLQYETKLSSSGHPEGRADTSFLGSSGSAV